jgi:enoyl-CoA hydratase/carnithine racemase
LKEILYRKDGRIAYITLNRPDKLNSISASMVNSLQEIWKDFRDDDSCWVAIISGEGRAFCSGGVVENLPTGKWKIAQSIAVGDRVMGPGRHNIWKPIIAALHGYVFGAGFWMAMECDLRVAADNTVFSLPEPRVGFPTTFAAFVPRFIPQGIAAEMLYVAERIDIKRAYDLGFINRVVPLRDLMKEAAALAERVCENAPLAVRAMKKVMKGCTDLDSRNLLKISEEAFRSVYESEDVVEGKRAFKEKRKPDWKGK